jgi:MoaA/NifB/PqqE/SkfB family radical SAM enzyme
VSAAGEPLLHPEFIEIIRLLKTTDANIKLLSNGSLLNAPMAQHLLDHDLDELRISLWAKDEKEFAANYPGTDPKFFRRVKDNVKRMTGLKKTSDTTRPKLSIHHPINHNNFQNLQTLLPLAEELGLNEISFSALIPYPEVDQKSLLKEEDLPRFKTELYNLKKPLAELNVEHNIDETIFQQENGADMVRRIACYNGWFQLRIQEDGHASPCNTCNIFVGNAHESTVMELWKGKAMQSFRERACTFEGLSEIARHGFCDFCSSYHINRKIHRIVCWLPFTQAGR